jgi:hypothetical protein
MATERELDPVLVIIGANLSGAGSDPILGMNLRLRACARTSTASSVVWI